MRVQAIPARLRTKAGGKWLRGNTITLLENGEAFFPALLEAIDAAQQEILLQTYIFATDATGLRVIDALTNAKGVDFSTLVNDLFRKDIELIEMTQ
ncbi:MAG: hypothetical protein FWG52_08365 [Proteobacteria bacterium]|nr:hypothetical protein [Pseudomonadota bacterium]